MRLSHIAVLAMLALSVVVDGLIPFPLPDSGGRDRSGLAAPDPEVSLVYYAAVKADDSQAPTQEAGGTRDRASEGGRVSYEAFLASKRRVVPNAGIEMVGRTDE